MIGVAHLPAVVVFVLGLVAAVGVGMNAASLTLERRFDATGLVVTGVFGAATAAAVVCWGRLITVDEALVGLGVLSGLGLVLLIATLWQRR